MNINIFKRIGLIAIMGLTIVACSQNEDATEVPVETPTADASGLFHYQMDLNCNTPTFNDEVGTRAMTYNWDNGSMLFVRFKSGSSYVSGTATYSVSSNMWDVAVSSTLPVSSNEQTCELYYFVNASSVTSSSVTMTEKTACFYTTSATYKHPSESAISILASLSSKTWRLRFKGTPGSTINMPGSSNDISYYGSFNRTTGNFTTTQKDVSLTVGSDGYTPYIYGAFNNSGNNKITVYVGEKGYYRDDIASSMLAIGESGYFTVPSSKWILIPGKATNCDVEPDLLVAYTDGMVTSWNVGSNVATCYTVVMNESTYSQYSDDTALENYLNKQKVKPASDVNDRITGWWSSAYQPNTQYYLCTVAYNSDGKSGNVIRKPFKTLSTSIHIAEISNISTMSDSGNTYWTWDMTLKNGATKYYLYYDEDSSDDVHWIGWWLRSSISQNKATAYDWEHVQLGKDGSTLTLGSWALNSNNVIGGFHSANSSTSSRQSTPSVIDNDINGVVGSKVSVSSKTRKILKVTSGI